MAPPSSIHKTREKSAASVTHLCHGSEGLIRPERESARNGKKSSFECWWESFPRTPSVTRKPQEARAARSPAGLEQPHCGPTPSRRERGTRARLLHHHLHQPRQAHPRESASPLIQPRSAIVTKFRRMVSFAGSDTVGVLTRPSRTQPEPAPASRQTHRRWRFATVAGGGTRGQLSALKANCNGKTPTRGTSAALAACHTLGSDPACRDPPVSSHTPGRGYQEAHSGGGGRDGAVPLSSSRRIEGGLLKA